MRRRKHITLAFEDNRQICLIMAIVARHLTRPLLYDQRALHHYRLASQQHIAQAYFNLAYMYENGEGVDQV